MTSSRGFTGTRFTASTGSQQNHRAELMEKFARRKRGERETKQTQEDRYDQLVKKKMEEVRAAAGKSTRYSVQLPGTNMGEGRELSKAAQDVIEKMAKEKAKKHAKKNMYKNIQIRARAFMGMQGGRINNKGKIFGPDGRYIAYVCTKTGKVKSRSGHTICFKYTDSTFCDYKISRFIQWQYDKKRMKNSLYAVNGFTTAGGGVYGSVKDGVHGGGNAGVYGSGGGWGNSGGNSGGGLWGNGGGWGDNGGTGGFWG